MSRDGRLPSGLFGFGVVIASSTLVWQGIKQAQAFIKAQHEVGKVPTDLSRQITADMLQQMEQGLAGDSRSSLLMLPSWLPSLPTGNESGSVFAIDFGGTSFRVMEVCLGKGPNEVRTISSIEIDIPSAIYRGNISDLYTFIASEVISFAAQRGLPLPTIPPPHTSTRTPETPDEKAPNPEASEESAATAKLMADSAADSAAAVEASAESDVAMTNCGGDADTATVSTGATGAGSTSSPPAATSGEGATSDVAAQLRAAVEAGRETDGGGMGGGEERSAEAPIGFCFSFPMKQSGMTTGYLLRWTKGFDLQDGIGSDPVHSLREALSKQGRRGNIAALLNDGIGVFGAGRYLCSDTAVSFILGTGTNAAYVERIANVTAMHDTDGNSSKGPATTGETVVNTEWGGFDSELLPRCEADVELDLRSVRPGAQCFEKLVGGLYVGEIVRRSFLSVVKETGMLNRTSWGRLTITDTLTAPQVQAADEDDSATQRRTAAVLMHAFGMRRQQCSLLVCWTLKQVVAAVVQRAADLIAAGLVALLYKVGAPEKGGMFGIAVDGSVYHKYPKFRTRLHIALARALMSIGGVLENPEAVVAGLDIGFRGPETETFRAKFVDVQNGSCFGASVVAATVGGNGLRCGGGEVQNLPRPEGSVVGSMDMQGGLSSQNIQEGSGGLRQRRGLDAQGGPGEGGEQGSDAVVGETSDS